MTSIRSAGDTGLPSAPPIELEDAIADAARMADVAWRFMGQTLGFEQLEAPKLNNKEAALAYWVVRQTSELIHLAERAYLAENGGAA